MTDIQTALTLPLKTCLYSAPEKTIPPHIAVAVSGGADSMAMAHILGQWRAQHHANFTIHILSVDHGLRENAAKEVEEACAAFHNRDGYTTAGLKVEWENGLPESGVMKAARDKRYALMQQYCEAHNIPQLYTGHHMDDQAETFLMRLTRGSGPDGLAAMPMMQPVKGHKLTVMRPLLHATHRQLVEYCAAHQLPWTEDPTNEDTQYTRNRMRRSMSILQEEGLTAQSLSRTAQRIARAVSALERMTDEALSRTETSRTVQSLNYNWQILQTYPEDIILRVLLRAYDDLRPDRYYRPRMERLEDILHDLLHDAKFKARSLGGLDIRLQGTELSLSLED